MSGVSNKPGDSSGALPAAESFNDILRRRAQFGAGRTAFTYLSDGEDAASSISYGALHLRSLRIARALADRGAAGERALLLFPSGLDYIAAFFGCLYAGVTAVTGFPPRSNPGRILAMAADCGARFALTDSATLRHPATDAARAGMSAGTAWLDVDGLLQDGASFEPIAPSPDATAFLQYTSGSTTMPRGVMVSHRNLLHNQTVIQRVFHTSAESRLVSWLPLFHDLGLISMVLHTVYAGAECVFMSPAHFLQSPVRWLRAISKYRGSISGGPNFAYDWCARRIKPAQRAALDLSSWNVAFNGAEPVRLDTLDRFAGAFGSVGFRRSAFKPVYGLAEATLAVTIGPAAGTDVAAITVNARALEQNEIEIESEAGTATRRIAGCGPGVGEQEVAIVNPVARERCPGHRVGEIWIHGPSVAQGYWGRDAESEKTFRARLADGDTRSFLRTGDLGFIHDGQLFITGRIKDVMIVRGRNVYPQDVEATAAGSHPLLAGHAAAAFSVEADGEEQVVVVQEAPRNAPADAILSAIVEAISREHEIGVHAVALVAPRTIPRTSSGKLQRSACREQWLAGSLSAVGAVYDRTSFVEFKPDVQSQAPPTTALEEWLVARIATITRLTADKIDRRAPFAAMGIDSVSLVALSGEIEERLGRRVSPLLLFEYSSVTALSEHLAPEDRRSQTAATEDAPLTIPATREPIAVVGQSCRYPDAPDITSFWRLLRDGVDAVRIAPASRWMQAGLPETPMLLDQADGARWGAFLDEVAAFDAAFFGISPREAAAMDPQQRLLLELSWEALEAAGKSPDALAGRAIGVFVGISTNDYSQLQYREAQFIDAHSNTGCSPAIAANRLSYFFDFRGPSMSVDTACSSSLVAIHLACRSIWSGESEMALAGGVNLMLAPGATLGASRLRALSPDGRCKAFDASANGYVRGEGGGIVVLKPLSAALADGDPILACVLGTAINQDGRSNGLTAPNAASQRTMIEAALRHAGVRAEDVCYVEAHGTGTVLGDPIEARTIGEVLGGSRDAQHPLLVGSVKTNIGHLEAAAGIAGFQKTVLALQRREIPPSLHFKNPNPHIDFDELRLKVPTAPTPLNGAGRAAVAGVSSFGFGGSNAHVLLGEAPALQTPIDVASKAGPVLLPVSARSSSALNDMAALHAARLRSTDAGGISLHDYAHSAAVRRAHHPHRFAVVAATADEAALKLEAFRRGDTLPGLISACTYARPLGLNARRKLVLVFSGQGSQWAGMGRELFREQPVFRAMLERCDEAMRGWLGWSVAERIARGDAKADWDDVDVIQPLVFAIQVSLAAVLTAAGIEPDAVAGHSLGEAAAAYSAGALSLQDAARVVCCRSRVVKERAASGAMGLVELPWAEIEATIARHHPPVHIAAINGPRSTVISGTVDGVTAALAAFEKTGVFCRRVNVSFAAHSPEMESLSGEILSRLDGMAARAPRLPFYSSVAAGLYAEPLDAHYWERNLRSPVRFMQTIERAVADSHNVFLEVSPHPIVTFAIEQTLAAANASGAVIGSLRRGEAETASMLSALGSLYVAGVAPDFARLYPSGRCVPLPAYAWQRERFWFRDESATAAPHAAAPETTSEKAENASRQADAISDDKCLYEIRWARIADAESRTPSRGAWIVLAGQDAVSRALIGALESHGEACIVVQPGEAYRELNSNDVRLQPDCSDDFGRLFRTMTNTVIHGVVHAWSLEAPSPDDCGSHSFDAAERLGCRSLLALLQQMAVLPHRERPHVWIVTRGAQAVLPQDRVSMLQAPLWGFGRALQIEHPEYRCRLLDLDAASEASSALIARRFLNNSVEDQIAVRGSECFGARLAPSDRRSSTRPPARLRAEGAYLITGGLGAIGLAIAERFAEAGARRLVLTGRKAPNATAQEAIRRIERQGADVHVFQADVADLRQVRDLVKQIGRDSHLHGVVHAAGVLEDRPIVEMDAAAFQRVAAPKIEGAWNLHSATLGQPLDFFLLFSSAVAWMGAPGQANYSAANSFLEALAYERTRQGLPATSIQWGPWSEIGLAAERRHSARLADRGLGSLTTARGLDLTFRFLHHAPASIGIFDLNLKQWRESFSRMAHSPLFSGLMAAAGLHAEPKHEDAGVEILALRNRAAQVAAMYALAEKQIAHVLRTGAAQIEPDIPLQLLGLDSLMAMELRNRLESRLGIELPATLVWTYPTLERLSEGMLDRLLAGRGEKETTSVSDSSAVDEAGEVNEDQLIAMLQDELSRIDERL